VIASLVAMSLAPMALGYMEIDASAFPRIAVFGPPVAPGAALPMTEDGRPVDAQVSEGKDAGLRLVLVLDSSASMTDATLADLQRTLPAVLRDLEGDARFALLDVDSSARVVCPFTPAVEELSVALEQPTAGGGDALDDGLSLALEMLGTIPPPRAILYITDGREPDGLAVGEETATLAVEAGVPVFAIGLGVRVDTASLAGLGERTGGEAWFMSRQGDVASAVRQMAHTVLSRSRIRFDSPDSASDGRRRLVAWPDAHKQSLAYRAPLSADARGWVRALIEGVDGPRGAMPVVAYPEGGGELRVIVAGPTPAQLPAGRYRFEAVRIGRPSTVATVAPGETAEVRLRMNGRLLVQAPVLVGKEPDLVTVLDPEGGRVLGYGSVGCPIDLVAASYALEVGVGSQVERRVVDVTPGRTAIVSLAEFAAFMLQLADADGLPLSRVVYLKSPDTWETVATGRSGVPIEAPPGRYLMDYDLPHGGGMVEVTLSPGRTTEQWIGPAARLSVECRGSEGFVSPPLFLKPKGGTRAFAMGRPVNLDLVAGEYELTVASLPPIAQPVSVTEGQKAALTFDRFGALLVPGPQADRYRLVRASDGQWVGVFHFGETVHLVADTYHVLPLRARQDGIATEVTVVPLQTVEVSIEMGEAP